MAAQAAYGAAFQGVRDQGLLRGLPTEEVAGLFTLGFLYDQVRKELEQLAQRLAELRRP